MYALNLKGHIVTGLNLCNLPVKQLNPFSSFSFWLNKSYFQRDSFPFSFIPVLSGNMAFWIGLPDCLVGEKEFDTTRKHKDQKNDILQKDQGN